MMMSWLRQEGRVKAVQLNLIRALKQSQLPEVVPKRHNPQEAGMRKKKKEAAIFPGIAQLQLQALPLHMVCISLSCSAPMAPTSAFRESHKHEKTRQDTLATQWPAVGGRQRRTKFCWLALLVEK